MAALQDNFQDSKADARFETLQAIPAQHCTLSSDFASNSICIDELNSPCWFNQSSGYNDHYVPVCVPPQL